MIEKIKKYFSGVREEMKRVEWLSQNEVVTYSLIVVVISAIIAIYLGVLDIIFSRIILEIVK